MSGTPLQNSHEDIFAYLHFLRHPTHGSIKRFKRQFGGRYLSEDSLQQLQKVLQPIMLRRTKESRINGEPILHLPKKCVFSSDVKDPSLDLFMLTAVGLRVQA